MPVASGAFALRQQALIDRLRGGPEFGTNTGRQGTFDPDDPDQRDQAVTRLQELQTTYGDRLRPNATGETGLSKDDAQGWSRYQNAITEAENIKRLLAGRAPLGIRFGGVLGPQNEYLVPPARVLKHAYDFGVGPFYASHDQWKARRGFP